MGFKIRIIKNNLFHLKREKLVKIALSVGGSIFLGAIYLVFYKILLYFKNIPFIGPLLMVRLLSMVFLTFLSMLFFSNIIFSLSTIYLSSDLNLLLGAPLPFTSVFAYKLGETIVQSSWMVLLFGAPIFIAYGQVYEIPLPFYLFILCILPPFLSIPAGVGASLTVLLARIFPAGRTKEVLFILSILFGVVIYLTSRLLQPERFLDPGSFSTLIFYLNSLKPPGSPYLPSQWATDAFISVIGQNWREYLRKLFLLSSCGFLTLLFSLGLAHRVYYSGWTKAQEGGIVPTRRKGSLFLSLTGEFFLKFLPLDLRSLALKDARLFRRDVSQWSQLFLLLSLVVVYLYNFKVLPLKKYPLEINFLQNVFSFLNLGLAGFVLAAVGARFVYPSISWEGKSFWIIKAAPIEIKRFLREKFLVSFIPLLILAEILVISSNLFLGANSFIMGLSIATVFLLTLGITNLGIGMGAIYPHFEAENPAQPSTGIGGVLYMVLSLLYIAATVALEARPLYLYFTQKLSRQSLYPYQWLEIGICILLLIAINILVNYLPFKYGIRVLVMRDI